ncbi:ATP/GTP-binding protein [Aquipuribacter hungaricus]|uniref:ATP/GTP-binding protein n=1 Tax=Aquipuribacter hungaricus TaxID=545624 RepID=A0ABV7WN58_9MICO
MPGTATAAQQVQAEQVPAQQIPAQQVPAQRVAARARGASRLVRPSGRGWSGRGRGYAGYVQAPAQWRGTTVQVCGLWPFAVGAGTPMVGVPLGQHIDTGATLCCDPVSWFRRGGYISNPSAFVLGLPGLGKSTLVTRMLIGLAGFGVLPLVLGDLKPDYVAAIEALGGQVITLGPGRGYLNVLDPGEAPDAAARLKAAGHTRQAEALLADAHSKRLQVLAGLITIMRGEPVSDRETTILSRALTILDDRHPGVPVLADLLRVIQDASPEVRAVALDRGDDHRYQAITENLEASLIGLINGGKLGDVFSRPTTNPMRFDAPVVYDVHSLEQASLDQQAATLLACWSAGFGTVTVANVLADAGLEPRRHYVVVLDELWRALRAGKGMVDRVDSLTRLNRSWGVGQIMVSHTMSDLLALPSEEDRMKARGFVERSGLVFCGGLSGAEMPLLNAAVQMSQAEQNLLMSWRHPEGWNPEPETRDGTPAPGGTGGRAKKEPPPGRGKFIVKVGGRPGIPVQVKLTEAELSLKDSNHLWQDEPPVPATVPGEVPGGVPGGASGAEGS